VTNQAHRDGLTRLWLEINPTNTPSQKVAERAGYTFEHAYPTTAATGPTTTPTRTPGTTA
jgi:RimJ/RimL family protein N-acetyltransferase